MFKIYYPVHDILKRMLTLFPNSAPDGVNKVFGFAYILTKKGIKFFPVDKNISVVLYFTLVLLPIE